MDEERIILKIQVINYDGNLLYQSKTIICRSLKYPRSLDEFDVNIVDLTSTGIWRNSNSSKSIIENLNDFKSIKTMLLHSEKAKNILVMPRNISFYYYPSGSNPRSILLKDMLEEVNSILNHIYPYRSKDYDLIFESTETTLNNKAFYADFYFSKKNNSITKSDFSEKATTVCFDDGNLYLTTLNIACDYSHLNIFLDFLFPSEEKELEPEWVKQISILDDIEKREIIKEAEEIIKEKETDIEESQKVLEKNSRYKSILYTNGDKLVEVVFDVLEQILDCDLSDFKDEKKEDFRIVKKNCTIIGEIKGTSSNIRRENISQLDNHYQTYLDKLDEEGKSEKVYQLLIMNPLRNKPLDEREPVCEDQINLAKRNGSLIVTTKVLLALFEKFMNKELTTDQCLYLLTENTGLLTI